MLNAAVAEIRTAKLQLLLPFISLQIDNYLFADSIPKIAKDNHLGTTVINHVLLSPVRYFVNTQPPVPGGNHMAVNKLV
jgi:hypothetical protein